MKATSFPLLTSLVGMALAVSCSPNSSRQPTESLQPQQLLETYANNLAKNHKWVSFDCELTLVDPEGIKRKYDGVDRLSYCYTDEYPSFYYTRDSVIFFNVSPEAVRMVNFDDNVLTTYHHTDNSETDRCYCTWKNQIESGWLGDISLFFQCATPDFPPSPIITFIGHTDTTVRGVPCARVYGTEPMGRWKRGEGQGVTQLENHFWINRSTGMLDSLVKIEIADTTRLYAKETYSIKDVSYEDKSAFFDSVFDFGSPRYGKFSVSDEHDWLRPGVAAGRVEDGLFGFPMVDLHGDTCFLREIEGWKLLHLWCFRCGSCIRQLEKWGEERDSLGYRFLQDKGLKILSVNYSSDNFDKLKQIAEKTNSDDILYSSKGMDQFIHLPSLGHNYLLSPNNEIVFQSPFIVGASDYSAILEAKANYEKQHKKR